jgi:hypothetical protein
MAKEYYDVSYKTYFNDRIKPVRFRGEETYPLYVQVTYDRRTLFFKSYYFDLFSQPKYDFLGITISQIDHLESQVLDFIVARNADGFKLNQLPHQYKVYSQDVLERFDVTFKMWLATYLKKEGLSGLAALVEFVPDKVCAIQVWDDLRKILDLESFTRMERMAVLSGPYLFLATYVRHVSPVGPFCLPLHEWAVKEKREKINYFIFRRFWSTDHSPLLQDVDLLLPKGF